jgi:hypothetical protein
LARRAIDLARLDRAIKNWPTGDWHTEKIVGEYHFALSRGIAGARFLRWWKRPTGSADNRAHARRGGR